MGLGLQMPLRASGVHLYTVYYLLNSMYPICALYLLDAIYIYIEREREREREGERERARESERDGIMPPGPIPPTVFTNSPLPTFRDIAPLTSRETP